MRHEAHEAWWLIKVSLGLALAAGLAAALSYTHFYLFQGITYSFNKYWQLFIQLIYQPDFKSVRDEILLAGAVGAMVGGILPILFISRK